MALITLVGYPSSGKSTRAQQLHAFLVEKLGSPECPPHLSRLKLHIINDESLGLSKYAYDDSRAEKPARATLFSAVQRSLNKDTIVIVDAMNYIKGSRYQMYCQAREMVVRTCTVFIATPPDQCRAWNASRPPAESYAEATLDNLISRFEEPNSAARWDSPLVTVPFFDPSLSQVPSVDAQRIWDAITVGDVKPPNIAVLPISTSTTSYLSLLESITTSIITTLLAQQSLSPLSGPTTLVLSGSRAPIRVAVTVNRTVSMPMLQRIKRQYVTMNQRAGQGTELGEEQVAKLFAEYLENNL